LRGFVLFGPPFRGSLLRDLGAAPALMFFARTAPPLRPNSAAAWFGRLLAVVLFFLARRDTHHLDDVADHVGGALLAFSLGPVGIASVLFRDDDQVGLLKRGDFLDRRSHALPISILGHSFHRSFVGRQIRIAEHDQYFASMPP